MSDSVFLLVHTIVGWVLIVGSPLLLWPVAQFLRTNMSALPLDACGHYFAACAGALNLIWGVMLVATSGEVADARLLVWPNAFGFALVAALRIPLSRNADVIAGLGKGPQAEVIGFAAVALFFAAAAITG